MYFVLNDTQHCDEDAKLKNKKIKQNKNERGECNGTTTKKKKKYPLLFVLSQYNTRSDSVYFRSIVRWTYLRRHYISLNLVPLKHSIAQNL